MDSEPNVAQPGFAKRMLMVVLSVAIVLGVTGMVITAIRLMGH